MKLTETVIELMFELSNLEGEKNAHYLDGDRYALRNNLIKLFKVTDNPVSHELIIDIMNEAGYPWFGKLARSEKERVRAIATMPAQNDGQQLLSDDEFMDLLPINGQIH